MVGKPQITCPCRPARHPAPVFMLSGAASEGRGKSLRRRPGAAEKVCEAASEGCGEFCEATSGGHGKVCKSVSAIDNFLSAPYSVCLIFG